MGAHAYCIVRADSASAAQVTGIAGVTVELAAAGRIGCWLSVHGAKPAVSVAAVRDHDTVVRAAMSEAHTPVPLRFGQWFADREAAGAAVAADAARWHSLLDRFEGAAEYGIRVDVEELADTARDVRPGPVDTGTAYMAALARRAADAAERRREGDTVAAWILERLGPLARESRTEPLNAGGGLINLAVLVAWPDASAYHSVVRDARATRADLRFLVSGPWPPYSFVS